MDPLTLAAMGSTLLGAASKAKSSAGGAGPSGATGGYATSSGALDSSNWTVNIGGTAPGLQLASGGLGWLAIAAIAAVGYVWLKKS